MTETKNAFQKAIGYMRSHEGISPLVVFRIVFGLMMCGAVVRFWANGWIATQYIQPDFFFSYQFFSWVKPLGDPGTYILFAICGIAAFFIAIGLFYRFSAAVFFLSFTYIELMDKTNYLNHYYFVTLVAFLMIFIPAHRSFSLDVKWRNMAPLKHVPRIFRHLLIFQLGVVYFYAGLAKLNSDWLFLAQPMDIWLKAFGHWPLIGDLMDNRITAYAFSWAGAIYDLSIPFLLYFSRTRPPAYIAVIVFHVATAVLFPIGMFPFVMIGATLVFFPPKFHDRILARFGRKTASISPIARINLPKRILVFVGIYAILQLAIPFRHILQPGELFWHEQGYRFSWRVMLMEKAGAAFFYVQQNPQSRPMEIRNADYLTPNQEKMMATQPDMLIEYAHLLKRKFEEKGLQNPKITAKVFVTLNGRPSRPFIDPNADLAALSIHGSHSQIPLLPFDDEISGL
ncbi:MAG: HTTM domain-containing protein [Cryomorphaceae bacterium]|nr:HTTM domain-containing protein [Flavobacteriales bacterium]